MVLLTILCALLILLPLAVLIMFGKGTTKLRLLQPGTKKKVIELEVTGWFGRWMWNHNWGGYTLPLPGVTFIFYWLLPGTHVDPLVRVHEFVHVRQAESVAFALLFWEHYDLEAIEHGYAGNKYEAEAYAVEAEAAKNGLPDWAKTQS